MRVMEVKARDSYEQDIITFKNFEIIETMTRIKNDEEDHIRILDNIVKLLEG